jgi:hypothetical protein
MAIVFSGEDVVRVEGKAVMRPAKLEPRIWALVLIAACLELRHG